MYATDYGISGRNASGQRLHRKESLRDHFVSSTLYGIPVAIQHKANQKLDKYALSS